MNRLFQQFDIEMEKRGLDTAVVIGESTLGNPELAYVAGTTVPRGGIFVERRRCNPILVVTNIDVGSAKRGRVKDVRTYSDYGYEKLVERHGRERAYIMLIGSILRSVRARGRVSIYGHNEFSRLLSIVGLTIGERPYLSLFSDDTLRKNQVVTVELGLYDPRRGGVRIEDTILIKGRRIDNLTPLEKELEI